MDIAEIIGGLFHNMKTKAAILYKINSPLVIDEVEIPALNRGQVLVKMLAAGICRSQLNEIKGYKGEDKNLPHLLGHEGAAEVLEIGSGVTKVKKGDFVVLSWIKGKGLSGGPVKYGYNNTFVNAGAVSTFSEYAVISENRLFKISKEIPPDIAVLLGCAVPTGAGIVINTLKVKKGSEVAIFGVGGVGANVILAAATRHCQKIIAVDVSDEKLAFAVRLGATDTINVTSKDIYTEMQRIVPEGVDYAVEASGVKSAMEMAYAAAKDTGIVVVAGNLKKDDRISINPFDLIKGKKIIGSWGGETDPDKDIPYYAQLYLRKFLKLGKLITRRFTLENVNQAFKLMEVNKVLGRMIIIFK